MTRLVLVTLLMAGALAACGGTKSESDQLGTSSLSAQVCSDLLTADKAYTLSFDVDTATFDWDSFAKVTSAAYDRLKSSSDSALLTAVIMLDAAVQGHDRSGFETAEPKLFDPCREKS